MLKLYHAIIALSLLALAVAVLSVAKADIYGCGGGCCASWTCNPFDDPKPCYGTPPGNCWGCYIDNVPLWRRGDCYVSLIGGAVCTTTACDSGCCQDAYCIPVLGMSGTCGAVDTSQNCIVYDTGDSCKCYHSKKTSGSSCPGDKNECCQSNVCVQKADGTSTVCCKDSSHTVGETCGNCGKYNCDSGDWVCADQGFTKYHPSGEFTSTKITFAEGVPPRPVNLTSVSFDITTPGGSGSALLLKYSNSSDGIIWQVHDATGAVANQPFTLSEPVLGKYFNITLQLNSNPTQTITPTVTSINLRTSPRLTSFDQGPTVGQCSPTSMEYICARPFASSFIGASNTYEDGTIQACDDFKFTDVQGNLIQAANNTVVKAVLNATEYTEKNLTDNFMAVQNNGVCSS